MTQLPPIDLATRRTLKEAQRPRLMSRRPPRPFCRHEYVEIDDDARELVCADCKADVDPFAFLVSIARDGDWVVALRRERSDLAKEVVALKAERDRLKSSVRGLRVRRGIAP